MRRAKLLNRRPGVKLVLRDHELLRCPHLRYQATWCRRMCVPIEGMGTCGRLAPHAMKDRIQRAIAARMAEAAAEEAAVAKEAG
jgi:hypothetical protein